MSQDKIITNLNENDVLLGRGGNNNKHVGNEKLRNLARSQVISYTRASKKSKSDISRSLVCSIRKLGGRFLKRDPSSKYWRDVGDDAAREKASQVLRDAVAELGKKVSSPTQDQDDLMKVPSLPDPYKYDYDVEYNHRTKRCKITTEHYTEDENIFTPPRISITEYHDPYIVSQVPVHCIDSRRHLSLVTPEDPEHKRDIYSRKSYSEDRLRNSGSSSSYYHLYHDQKRHDDHHQYNQLHHNDSSRIDPYPFWSRNSEHHYSSNFEGYHPMEYPIPEFPHDIHIVDQLDLEVNDGLLNSTKSTRGTTVSSSALPQSAIDEITPLSNHDALDNFDLFKW